MASDALQAARIQDVRHLCESSIRFDAGKVPVGCLTDRAWLAQSVLNILDGMIDQQLITDLEVGHGEG